MIALSKVLTVTCHLDASFDRVSSCDIMEIWVPAACISCPLTGSCASSQASLKLVVQNHRTAVRKRSKQRAKPPRGTNKHVLIEHTPEPPPPLLPSLIFFLSASPIPARHAKVRPFMHNHSTQTAITAYPSVPPRPNLPYWRR